MSKPKQSGANKDKRERGSNSDDSFANAPSKKQQKITSCINKEKDKDIDMKELILAEIKNLESQLRDILKDELSELKQSIQSVLKQNEQLSNELDTLRNENRLVKSEINQLEQYTRRNNVRIFGVEDNSVWETAQETEAKAIRIFNNRMHLNIQPEDIEAVHRIGKFSTEKKRAIIIRLVSRKTREKIMKAKTALKGSGVFIAEDLTRANAHWFFQIKHREDVKLAWTQNGVTFAVGEGGGIVKVPLNDNIDQLAEKLKNTRSKN